MGSNQRPSGYEPPALTPELRPQDWTYFSIKWYNKKALMERIKTAFRRLGYRIKHWFSQERAIFLVGVGLCLIWTWGAISAMSRNWELEQRLIARQNELSLLQLEIESLELENQYYASEEYQELAARDLRNKVADGETLIYLPVNSDFAKHKHENIIVKEEVEEPTNFEQWMSFIFGM